MKFLPPCRFVSIPPRNTQYGVKLTVAGDNVKAWLDDELIFDEMLKPLR